ncbi:hypothetical protein NST89_09480 [Caldifermentibacillus hisashii]|uniref:hypothetical protein n=1 Tax=Caldifermentibacillus hisashii TaxID=996558 RepID=UPI0031355071
MVTRTGLVAKKSSFPLQKGDEIGSRRQILHFSPQNGDEIGFRRQNRAFFTSKR